MSSISTTAVKQDKIGKINNREEKNRSNKVGENVFSSKNWTQMHINPPQWYFPSEEIIGQ